MQLPESSSGWLKWAALAVAALAAFLAYRHFAPELDLEEMLDTVAGTLGTWTYLIVSILAFLETGAFVGLIAPGETFVVLAGAVAGVGETSVALTLGLVWLSAFAGDTASFYLGRKLGRGFILRHGERVRITRERFAQVEQYFDRHGGKTILIGRFLGLVRALAPFIAGSSAIPYRAIAPYSVLGTGIWAAFFTLLGYLAARNLEEVVSIAERGVFAFGALVVAAVAVIWATRWLRVRENRRRAERWLERRRAGRWLLGVGDRLAPQLRFLRDRLTPGGLGIELTAALAVVAVGAYFFVAYAGLIAGDPEPTAIDRTAIDVVEAIRAGWLTEVQRVVTELGAGGVVAAVSLAAGALLAWRRRWEEVGMLVASVAVLAVAVPELKQDFDRPRPPDPLVATEDEAFPSGHAAWSVLYVWLGVVAAVRLRIDWASGTALIVGGVLVAAAVGLSRVYLGAHYYSDVLGGWGLGAVVFGLATAIGIAVFHFRHNGSDDA